MKMSITMDSRVIRTKSLLKDALLSLMLEKEYSEISVLEIAKRSTLNRATFYLHYYDKEELLQSILKEELDKLNESLQMPATEFKYLNSEPHPTFTRLFEQMYRNPTFYKLMLADAKVPYFTKQVMDVLDRFVKAAIEFMVKDEIKFSVPVDLHIAYIKSAFLGVIIWWLENDMQYTPKYMSTQLTMVSTKGPFEKNPYIH